MKSFQHFIVTITCFTRNNTFLRMHVYLKKCAAENYKFLRLLVFGMVNFWELICCFYCKTRHTQHKKFIWNSIFYFFVEKLWMTHIGEKVMVSCVWIISNYMYICLYTYVYRISRSIYHSLCSFVLIINLVWNPWVKVILWYNEFIMFLRKGSYCIYQYFELLFFSFLNILSKIKYNAKHF